MSIPVHPQHDTWLTDLSTFVSDSIPRVPDRTIAIDFRLDRSNTGVDELLALAQPIRRLVRLAESKNESATSALPEIADSVKDQREQSQITVPLLTAQLGLLAVVVFWLILGTTVEGRRSEVALALLHGRGPRGAIRRLMGELLPVIVVGALVGVCVGVVLCGVADRVFLPGRVHLELRWPPVLAVFTTSLILVTLAQLAARRVAREPLHRLLRSVAPRSTTWRLGSLETLLVSASGAAVVAFVTGGLSGPIALAAPGLLAVMVGVLLAHAIVPVAAWTGAAMLRRGHLQVGISVLNAARSSAPRRSVAVLTVATALLVFSADAMAVGARNRASAAEQEAGAAMVAEVGGTDLMALRDVLRQLDPQGDSMTPVVAIRAPDPSAPATLAVVPSSFRRIALFPGQSALEIPWQLLASPHASNIRLAGTRIIGNVAAAGLTVGGVGGESPPRLTLQLVTSAGPGEVSLGRVAPGNNRHTFRKKLPCRSGCLLAGVQVSLPPASEVTGKVTLSNVVAGNKQVHLGPGSQWSSGGSRSGVDILASPDQSQLTLDVHASATVTVRQAWFPLRVPAIVAGRLPSGSRGNEFDTNGMDGRTRRATRIATVPRVPASPADTALVNLDVLERGSTVASQDRIMIWFAKANTESVARVERALRAKHVDVSAVSTLRERRRLYDESLPAWSLQLASVVGPVCLLLAVLAQLLISAATRPLRSHDLAALRMHGFNDRAIRAVAVAEPVMTVALSVGAGMLCGVVGAHFSLPTVPMLATTPSVSTLDVSTAWLTVGAATCGALLVLTLTGWSTGRGTVADSHLKRIQEPM